MKSMEGSISYTFKNDVNDGEHAIFDSIPVFWQGGS